jgi:hypothetical protein
METIWTNITSEAGSTVLLVHLGLLAAFIAASELVERYNLGSKSVKDGRSK